ncbi:MAG: GlcNAc-PI de-N-acetylase [Acidimicrobiia bacterium]
MSDPILVVAAHPDDEVLGCGATAARLASEGREVHIAILGEGITSRYDQRGEADLSLIAALKARSQRAADRVGARQLQMFDFPDNRFDSVPLLDIVKVVEKLVSTIRPSTIYTHSGGDLNIDHVVLHRAVLTATRPLQGTPVREIYAFEIPSSSDWTFGQFAPTFRPNVFVDVEQTLEAKVEAMEVYDSERRAFPHPRSPEALRATARRWGSVVGAAAAEAFELIRAIR